MAHHPPASTPRTTQLTQPPDAPIDRATPRRVLGWVHRHWSGLALAAVAVLGVEMVSHRISGATPLLIAIIAGAVVANVTSLPQRLQPGLQFCSKRLLRLGVALLGLQITFTDILGLGAATLAVVVAVVALGIGATMVLGRLLGMSWTQRLLIACGFSICGAAAVAAVDGVIKSDEEELITALALVVAFGTLLIVVLPPTAHALGLDEHAAGVWAGASIHEVAQVVAAGGALGGTALTVAVVVKLARVMLLAPVLAIVGWQVRRRDATHAGAGSTPLIPLFVLGFLACVGLRTTGVLPTTVVGLAHSTQTALLTAAMFALGTGVRLSALARVGVRPIALAAASTACIAAIGLAGAMITA